jgi:hypothetical protein
MKKSHALILASLVLAACATPEGNDGNTYTEKYTRTGTNISDRDRMGVRSLSTEEFEWQRAANSGTLVRDPAKTGK